MNKKYEIYKLLRLNQSGMFKIVKPHFNGIFRLNDKLYIEKFNDDLWQSCQFQLCDILNGTLEIISI